MKLFTAENMNHVLHLLAVVFLCGLWLPFWILIAITHQPMFRCSFCGFSDLNKYLANPHLRQQEKIANQRKAAQRAELYQKIINYPYLIHIAVGFFLICVGFSVLLVINKPASPQVQPAIISTPYPEPKTSAELLERAKTLSGASYSPTAYRWLKQIPKDAKEFPEAQKMIKVEEEKLKRETPKK